MYTSPLARARETAAAIARAGRLPVRVETGLNECDIGDWTGLSLRRARRRAEWRLVRQQPSRFRFPGGESFLEMQARVTGALERLVALHRGRTVVAVSHGDPIRVAIAHALGVHLDLFQRLVVAPGSVTAVRYHADGPRVLTLNSLGGDLAWLARA